MNVASHGRTGECFKEGIVMLNATKKPSKMKINYFIERNGAEDILK